MLTIQKLPLCSKGAPVAITLENSNHMRVTLLSYGATIQSIVVPDRNGVLTDVLLGYETVKEYEENDGYLGACIGRNGNRIAGAAFTLNGPALPPHGQRGQEPAPRRSVRLRQEALELQLPRKQRRIHDGSG